MDNTYTLLTYFCIPEEERLYLIPNDAITSDMRGWLTEAQNRFINSDDSNDGMKFLNTALSTEGAEEGFEEHLGIFANCKVFNDHALTPTTMDGGVITYVYLSGFAL